MDINHWNQTAHKAQDTVNSYNQHLSSLQKEIDGYSFRCPWCGKIHSISDAQIKKIRVGKDLIDTQYHLSSSTTTKTYVKTYYNVRFCKKCAAKNERNKDMFFTIGKILYGVLGICFLYWLITTDEKLGYSGWIGAILGYGMIALCALGAKDSVEENLFDTINLDYAYKGNAIG